MQVLPMQVVLADFDFERPASPLSQSGSVTRSHAQSGAEVFDYPGEYTVDGDGTAYARIRAQEQQASYRVASAQTDARGVACGHTFKVRGLPDGALDDEYLVVSTNIHVQEGVQVGGEEGGEGHYACDFQAMPTADTFRAPRVTPKPMVYGPQTAKVVGPSGEPVYTDKYGRVKVQFHWDRLGKNDDKSSCWVRVSQLWAGNGFGAISIPRIGDEVVVSFLEGDPDQPLITGRVYNAQFMPPYALPANSHTTTILSRSMGSSDGDSANELRFCDKPGEEYIWLQAQKDFHREVENNDHDTIKNDQYITVVKKRQEDIGTDLEQTIGGKAKIKVASDYHVTAGGDHLHDAGGVININAGGDFALESGGKGGIKTAQALDIKAGMDVKTEAGMSMHIKAGMSLTIESGMSITLKAGAGTIVIGPGTISIDAPMVNINGGGGGGSASAASPAKPAKPEAPAKPAAVKDPLARKTAAAKTSNASPAAKKAAAGAAAPAAKKAPAAKSASARGHFTQEQSNSCVVASSRNMIHQLTGQNIPESQLRQEMREIMNDPDHDFETTPINPAHAQALMQRHGVTTTSRTNVSSAELATLTQNGPALVGFRNPGHRVMLDSVSTDAQGNRTYNVRDPDPAYGGQMRQMSQSQFDAKYNPNAIVIQGTGN